jgi:hypothetical protein
VQILSRMQLDDFTPVSFPLDRAREAVRRLLQPEIPQILINCNEDLADM